MFSRKKHSDAGLSNVVEEIGTKNSIYSLISQKHLEIFNELPDLKSAKKFQAISELVKDYCHFLNRFIPGLEGYNKNLIKKISQSPNPSAFVPFIRVLEEEINNFKAILRISVNLAPLSKKKFFEEEDFAFLNSQIDHTVSILKKLMDELKEHKMYAQMLAAQHIASSEEKEQKPRSFFAKLLFGGAR